ISMTRRITKRERILTMPTESEGEWHDLCPLAEVEEEEPFFAHVAGKELMVVKAGDDVSVFTDSCPHIGASMVGATVEDGHIECPLHGACFDALSGEVSDGPTNQNLERHSARVDGDRVFVCLSPPKE
ncbi:MAG: Rieske (2Fe-2S) protein, partial [Planctomycetota bacterium]|nr:Rieske (2Fe-2S) protein [Planctomycetota bacterium]